MINKILSKIANKINENLSDYDKKRMAKFPQARTKLVDKMIKKDVISENFIRKLGILLTFFGCGKSRFAPGTVASFVTVLLWLGISLFFFRLEVENFYELTFWLAIITLLFIYGLLTIPLYTKLLNSPDHPSIVIDEVIGQLTALCLTYPFVKSYYFDDAWFLSKLIMCAHIFSCFIFFRFLDIAKPFFIGWIDRNIKNSFGVMFDDLVCGLVAAAINISIFIAYQDAIIKLHSF